MQEFDAVNTVKYRGRYYAPGSRVSIAEPEIAAMLVDAGNIVACGGDPPVAPPVVDAIVEPPAASETDEAPADGTDEKAKPRARRGKG